MCAVWHFHLPGTSTHVDALVEALRNIYRHVHWPSLCNCPQLVTLTSNGIILRGIEPVISNRCPAYCPHLTKVAPHIWPNPLSCQSITTSMSVYYHINQHYTSSPPALYEATVHHIGFMTTGAFGHGGGYKLLPTTIAHTSMIANSVPSNPNSGTHASSSVATPTPRQRYASSTCTQPLACHLPKPTACDIPSLSKRPSQGCCVSFLVYTWHPLGIPNHPNVPLYPQRLLEPHIYYNM